MEKVGCSLEKHLVSPPTHLLNPYVPAIRKVETSTTVAGGEQTADGWGNSVDSQLYPGHG